MCGALKIILKKTKKKFKLFENGWFATILLPPGTFGKVWKHFSLSWLRRGVPLASAVGVRDIAKILQHKDSAPQERIIWSKTSIMMRLRNPVLEWFGFRDPEFWDLLCSLLTLCPLKSYSASPVDQSNIAGHRYDIYDDESFWKLWREVQM